MSKNDFRAFARDKDDADPDGLAAVPVLGLGWLFGAALLVPMLLFAGVYWLHHIPVGSSALATNAVVEVRLVSLPSQMDSQQESLIQPSLQKPMLEPAFKQPVMEVPTEMPLKAGEERTLPSSEPTPPQSSAAASPEPANRAAMYFRRTLYSHIAKYQLYPNEARNGLMQGVAHVIFTMGRDGTLASIGLKKSSGYAPLDAAALETVRKAQPLPHIPNELPERLTVLIPIDFVQRARVY